MVCPIATKPGSKSSSKVYVSPLIKLEVLVCTIVSINSLALTTTSTFRP